MGRNISAADLVDQTYLAYKGWRWLQAEHLLGKKMLLKNGWIWLSVTTDLAPVRSFWGRQLP